MSPEEIERLIATKRGACLRKIEAAQRLLYEACQETCPLHDWADIWTEIGNHADATKALWHRVNGAPRPTGCDQPELRLGHEGSHDTAPAV